MTRSSFKTKRTLFSIMMVALLVLSGLILLWNDGVVNKADASGPTRADGPVVNRTVITMVLHENFGQYAGDYFNMTGYGIDDVFFDPNYEWKEGKDIPYPNKAFYAKYPSGYTPETSPIRLDFVTYYEETRFGYVTITCQNRDFNSYIYGSEYFTIRLFGRNRTGISEAELRISVLNVNDPPTVISEKDFFSISFDEDGYYEGVNKDHDQPDDIFGDLKDPDETLLYTVEPMNPLAENISTDMKDDGSSIIFTPPADWSCPYVPTPDRLKGRNYRPGGVLTWSDFFAHFRFNCSDAAGAYVLGDLYVYVGPVNDTPLMVPVGDFYVNEDTTAVIDLEASDVDPENEQVLVFGTNITTIIYERTGIQLEFEEGYDFDSKEGILKFYTTNNMVGDYPVEAWVRDRPSPELGNKLDYPTTSFRVYSNFTLHIVNQNDPPKAHLVSPTSTFTYNTTWPIEFNASLSSDPDMVHGQVLTYKWSRNGEFFGEGRVIYELFENPGTYRIELNVTDGEFFSIQSVDINVEKTRILGEIFDGKDIERGYNDNATDPLVFHRSSEGNHMQFSGPDSIDIRSVEGSRDGAKYRIKVTFGEPMEYIYTDEKRQDPVLTVYFLKPDFTEDPVSPKQTDIPLYGFPVPTSNYRYNKMEFDLRTMYPLKYPLQDSLPGYRKLDTRMGVEITVTIVDLDRMNVRPDFELYVTAEMKTTIPESSGSNILITSWDAAGIGARVPQVDAGTADNGDQQDAGLSTGALVLIIVLIILVILAIAGVSVFLLTRKKANKKPDDQQILVPARMADDSVEDMIFGGPQVTAEQLYGPPQTGTLPQGEAPQGLPPAGSQVTSPTAPIVEPTPGQVTQGQVSADLSSSQVPNAEKAAVQTQQ